MRKCSEHRELIIYIYIYFLHTNSHLFVLPPLMSRKKVHGPFWCLFLAGTRTNGDSSATLETRWHTSSCFVTPRRFIKFLFIYFLCRHEVWTHTSCCLVVKPGGKPTSILDGEYIWRAPLNYCSSPSQLGSRLLITLLKGIVTSLYSFPPWPGNHYPTPVSHCLVSHRHVTSLPNPY